MDADDRLWSPEPTIGYREVAVCLEGKPEMVGEEFISEKADPSRKAKFFAWFSRGKVAKGKVGLSAIRLEDFDEVQIGKVSPAGLGPDSERAGAQVAKRTDRDSLTFSHGKSPRSSGKLVIWLSSMIGLPKSKASQPAFRAPSKSRE